MEHKTEQWCGEQLWSLFQKGCVFCWGTALKEMHSYIQIHEMPPKLSPQQPPWAQSYKELVKHPESSPCFSLMLKCNWCCPKANPINKGFLNNISKGWLGLWPCQAVARAGVCFMALTECPEMTAITFMTGTQRCCHSQVLHLYEVLNGHHTSHWGRPRECWVF